MLLFCPNCSNALVVEADHHGRNRFACRTCPYIHRITKMHSKRTYMKMKQIDDVLGGEEMWSYAPKTEAVCPNCGHKEAYYRQMQLRSADEPMTTFYRCANMSTCGFNWRGD